MKLRNTVLILIATLVLAGTASAQLTGGNPKNPKVIDKGRGWQLLEIWADGEDTSQPGTEVWMVAKYGVSNLPVSGFIRDGIADSFDRGDSLTTVLYHHKHLWELLEIDPNLAMSTYPEAAEVPEGSCPDQTRHKTGSVSDSVDVGERTFNLFDGVSGTLTVDVPIAFNGAYDLTYLKKRDGFLGICFTTGFRFVSVAVSGDANLAGTSDAGAQVQITGNWEKEWQIANPELVDTWFWVGPIPVNLEVHLPVHVGLEVDATLTGDLQLNSEFGATGSFDYLCTRDGCTGQSDFQDNFDFNDVDMGLELDVRARAFGRVGLFADVYSSDFAYGYAGVEGYLTGDFWGYYGSTCGDADGDGSNETVSAAVVDVGWGWDIQYEYGGWAIPDGEGTVEGDTGHLGWFDLLASSTALQPMLLGPATVETGTSADYSVQMRPCYPYTDNVSLSLSPGGWSGPTSVTPPNAVTVSRQFDESPSIVTLEVVAEEDAAGREIWEAYERDVEVTEPCPANTNLTVSLTSPDEGDEISNTLTFVANASDDVGVTQVKFRIDNSVVCTDSSSPWSCTLNVSSYPTGPYALTARAFGVCGNQKTSAPVNVVLNPEEPPPPAHPVSVAAVAFDPNSTLVGEVTSTPGGLFCSSDGNPSQCQVTVDEGDSITLHAAVTEDPIGLGIFEQWIGPDCPGNGSTSPDLVVTVSEEIQCTAMFRCDGSVPECIGGP